MALIAKTKNMAQSCGETSTDTTDTVLAATIQSIWNYCAWRVKLYTRSQLIESCDMLLWGNHSP